MTARLALLAILAVAIGGCTNMKPIDFKGKTPKFVLEEYFEGSTKAWGLFEDRFGRLRREFTVDIYGVAEGDTITLDERFQYADGETDRRVWVIVKLDAHRYEGRADDVVGVAKGESYGNALNWRYDFDLKVGDGTWRVRFDDWMFLQPSGVLLNRATVTKWGIEIGQVTLAFQKQGKTAGIDRQAFSGRPSVGAQGQAANQ